MRRRLFTAGLLALTVSAAGAASPAGPAPARVAVPLVPGDTFTYAFSDVTELASPNNPILTFSDHGTFAVAVSAGATFAGHTGLLRLRYSGSTPPTDEYVGFATGAGGTFEERTYGFVTSYPKQGSITRTIAGGSIENEYPEAEGRTWSPAADSETASLLDGSAPAVSLTVDDFADGSYHSYRVDDDANGKVRRGVTVTADGRAIATIDQPGYNPGSTSFGAPFATKTCFFIPATSAGANVVSQPPARPFTRDVPDWYPGHGAVPLPLLTISETVRGPVLTPAACGGRARLRAFDLRTTQRRIDPDAGTVEYVTGDEYDVARLGNACTIQIDRMEAYDNAAGGNLVAAQTVRSITILTAIHGPEPAAQPFSLDVAPVVPAAQFFPYPVDPGGTPPVAAR